MPVVWVLTATGRPINRAKGRRSYRKIFCNDGVNFRIQDLPVDLRRILNHFCIDN